MQKSSIEHLGKKENGCRQYLEMPSSSQSPRDRILWILSEHGGQMERGRLRRHAGMRYVLLDPILEELAREGRIRISDNAITLA